MTGHIIKTNLASLSALFGEFFKRAAGNRAKLRKREETQVSHKLHNSFLCIKN